MARRFHLALDVSDLAAFTSHDSGRLGVEPECVVPGEFALWRTEGLNLSIRVVAAGGFTASITSHTGMVTSQTVSGQLSPRRTSRPI